MTLIKIDRSSIRKNPKAGETVTYLPGTIELTGEYAGAIPAYYLHRLIITSIVGEIQYFIANGDPADIMPMLKEDKRASITITNNAIRYEHAPEPSYLYNYENTPVECSACKNMVNQESIISEWSSEGAHYYQCPLCYETNTFDLRYETIQEACAE